MRSTLRVLTLGGVQYIGGDPEYIEGELSTLGAVITFVGAYLEYIGDIQQITLFRAVCTQDPHRYTEKPTVYSEQPPPPKRHRPDSPPI